MLTLTFIGLLIGALHTTQAALCLLLHSGRQKVRSTNMGGIMTSGCCCCFFLRSASRDRHCFFVSASPKWRYYIDVCKEQFAHERRRVCGMAGRVVRHMPSLHFLQRQFLVTGTGTAAVGDLACITERPRNYHVKEWPLASHETDSGAASGAPVTSASRIAFVVC